MQLDHLSTIQYNAITENDLAMLQMFADGTSVLKIEVKNVSVATVVGNMIQSYFIFYWTRQVSYEQILILQWWPTPAKPSQNQDNAGPIVRIPMGLAKPGYSEIITYRLKTIVQKRC